MRWLVIVPFLMAGLLAHAESEAPTRVDPALNAAIDAARETLPLFLANSVTGEGALKVALPLETKDGYEHLWVAPFRERVDGTFEGVLTADPSHIETLEKGTLVTFSREDVTDWSAVIGGRGYGYFTLRAILHRVDPAKARVLSLFLADTPLPPEWRSN
ncbi:MAG: DUF2314 domain-containing protein [Pseudomonadota bacterium]